jgi:hypothetical protein
MNFTCEDCGQPCDRRSQRSTDDKWVCFDCLPAEDIDGYPGWREREALRRKRGAQARLNFSVKAQQ